MNANQTPDTPSPLADDLRAMFSERADEVTASGELWTKVEQRRRRGRVSSGVLVSLGAVGAAAVIAGGIAAMQDATPGITIDPANPGLVVPTNDADGPAPAPTEAPDVTPSPAPTDGRPTDGRPGEGTDGARGSNIVVIDGVPLPSFAVRTDGVVMEIVDLAWDLPGDDPSYVVDRIQEGVPFGGTFVSVHVRPGSTIEQAQWLTLVATDDDQYELRWMSRVGSEFTWIALPDQYQPRSNGEADGAIPTPVWAPDGTAFAYLDDGGARGDVTLRTVGAGKGPGTSSTATDNAEWALDGIGFLTLHDWRWDAATLETSGSILGIQPGGEFTAIRIDRQGDGALALVEVTSGGGEPVLALEDTERDDVVSVWRLTRSDDLLRLLRSGEDAGGTFETATGLGSFESDRVHLAAHGGAVAIIAPTSVRFVTIREATGSSQQGPAAMRQVLHEDRTLTGSWSLDWIA